MVVLCLVAHIVLLHHSAASPHHVVLCCIIPHRHNMMSRRLVVLSCRCVAPPCASHHTRFVWLVVASLRCALSLLPLARPVVATCHCVACCCCVASCLCVSSSVFAVRSGLVGCCVSCPQPLIARRHVNVDALLDVRFHIQLS